MSFGIDFDTRIICSRIVKSNFSFFDVSSHFCFCWEIKLNISCVFSVEEFYMTRHSLPYSLLPNTLIVNTGCFPWDIKWSIGMTEIKLGKNLVHRTLLPSSDFKQGTSIRVIESQMINFGESNILPF